MDADLILVGGGLANCLIALQLKKYRPEIRLLLLERNNELAGNHTWSFHRSDIGSNEIGDLDHLIEKSWEHYDVRFPNRTRRIHGSYHTIFSQRLKEVVCEEIGTGIVCNAIANCVTPQTVELADGRKFSANAVIDGRGLVRSDAIWVCYQKFVGVFADLINAHSLSGPLLMDATVEQREGFRFIYVLPFSSHHVLIEDTRYSDTPQLNRDEMQQEIFQYADRMGWGIDQAVRFEEGVLPVVLGGDFKAFWQDQPGVPRSGVRAGLFNHTTGYSLPEAIACASDVRKMRELSSDSLYTALRRRSEKLWKRSRFLRLLNRMLFLAAQPSQRYTVLEHFYRLPKDTVNRLYAGRPNLVDRFRILSGKPPVPVSSAIRAMVASRPVIGS